MGEVIIEVNALSEVLRQQRLGALEANALLRTVMEEIDLAVFTFDNNFNTASAVNQTAPLIFGSVIAPLRGIAPFPNTGGLNWQCLNAIPLSTPSAGGTDFYCRLGNKIGLVGCELIINVYPGTANASSIDDYGRILIIYHAGTLNAGTVPAMVDLLRDNNFAGAQVGYTAPSIGSFPSKENEHVFLFKRDFALSLPPYGINAQFVQPDTVMQPLVFRESIGLLGLQTEFTANSNVGGSGAYTDIQKGALLIFCASGQGNTATPTWTCSGESRVSFINL